MTAATAAALAITGALSSGATAATPPAAAGGDQAVIVVLANQFGSAPATTASEGERRARTMTVQTAVLDSLAGAKPSRVKHFSLGNAFSATVTAAQAAALAANPVVASVLPDDQVKIDSPQPGSSSAVTGGAHANAAQGQANAPARGSASQPICPKDPAKPLLEPEALTAIHAASTNDSPGAWNLANGAGVKVAFVADNMDPNSPDFIRPDGSKVFVDYKDFSGDGPNTTTYGTKGVEAFGDASSIAAQGVVVHDLSKFVNPTHPLPQGCNLVVKGVAPGASLIGLNYLGSTATESAKLQAIDYAVTVDHVDVLNESFGFDRYPDESDRSLLQEFNDEAVAAGVTVTASSGDAGITSTIGSPATDPKVISSGASTDYRLAAQTSYRAFGFSNGHWINDNISALSSSGITQNGRTIDLVAPGEANWSDCRPRYPGCLDFGSPAKPSDLQVFAGTSESAPLTAGVAALVIQAYRNTHHGQTPTPALVKTLITSTTTDLGLPADEQGTGLLNARAATEAAMTANGGTGGPGVHSNITVSQSQLSLSGAPGSNQHAKMTVTNEGTKPLTIATGTRGFAPLSSSEKTVAFDAKTLPTFDYFLGGKLAYKKVPFTVQPGTQRLLSRIAWQGKPTTVNGTPLTPVVVQLTLLAPNGTFAANSFPQEGEANYANVDVRSPAPGQWTAVLYSSASDAGYTGNVVLGTDNQRAVPYGTVDRPVFTLAPGASKPVTATMQTPASGGDAAYSITIASSDGHRTSVPVVLRSLIPTSSGAGHFSGTITGGNGRLGFPAQTFSYAFDVAKGHNDLDVALTLANSGGDLVDAVLVDLNGETADIGSNLAPRPAGKSAPGKGLQLFDANPIPGRWKLVVVVQNPVVGDTLGQRFDGTVSFDQVRIDAPALPNSPGQRLAAGKPQQVDLQVRNTGVAPIALGVDPRTNTLTTLQPVVVGGRSEVDLPEPQGQETSYLVPPNTTKFTVAAAATVPAQVLLPNPGGGITVGGELSAAQHGSTISVASIAERRGTVGLGPWSGNLQEIGPFGDAGAPKGSASYTGSLRTDGFDAAVSSTTGDPFAIAVDPGATGGKPMVIQPGKSAVIAVTINPRGQRGQRISGHLNLVTPPAESTGALLPAQTTGEVIASLPYSYTIV